MSDLRAVVRIKTMAQAAADVTDQPGPAEGREMAAAYERLRIEARALNTRAGWGDDDSFDREMPPVEENPVAEVNRATRMALGGDSAVKAVAAGRRARVLLRQLAAWAAGHQETFEIEERLKAEAQARASQKVKGPTGFHAS